MELITIDDQLKNINFKFNNTKLVKLDESDEYLLHFIKLDELDETLLYFGDIKEEKYSSLLGASRHITYDTNQHLAVKIGLVDACWLGPNHLRVDEKKSPNFIRFLSKLQKCITNHLDIEELHSRAPDQGLINEIVGETIDLEVGDLYDYPFFDLYPETHRLFCLKDVVGSDCIAAWFYGVSWFLTSPILVNRCCDSSIRKEGFFKCNLTIELDSIFTTTEPGISLMGSIIGIEKVA